MKNHGSVRRFISAFYLCMALTWSIHADAVVNQATDAALRAAIATGGNITFSVDGTITLNSSIVISNNTTIDATGRNIVIDGAGLTRLFQIESNVTANFLSLKLVNGKFHVPSGQPSTNAYGGAILNRSGALGLSNCILSNNIVLGGALPSGYPGLPNGAGFGGAIFSHGGSVNATNCVFTKNQANGADGSIFGNTGGHASGGAIAIGAGQLTLESCRLEMNNARAGGGRAGAVGHGGALYLTNQLNATISNTEFYSNLVQGGPEYPAGGVGFGEGGAIWNGGSLQMINSRAASNTARGGLAHGKGGAIFNKGSIKMNRFSATGNSAIGDDSARPGGGSTDAFDALGGGLYNAGTAAITNSTFLGNRALGGWSLGSSFSIPIHSGDAFGGGIYSEIGEITLSFCTLALNQTVYGRHGSPPQHIPGEAKGSDVYIASGGASTRSSVFGSVTNGSVFGPITDGGFNLIVDNSAGFSAATSLSSTDPKFGAPTETYIPLTLGSPGVNSADPINFPNTDQLGTVRPKGAQPDRGAIEFNSILMEGPAVSSPTSVQVTIGNYSGAGFIVQRSADLVSWTEVARTNATTTTQFNLEISGSLNFWRVISQP